jgi:phage-related protein
MNIYEWQTAGGKNEIEEYFCNTTQYEQAEYYKVKNEIETKGYTALLQLNTRKLYEKLWEIKISQNRIMYVVVDSDNVYFIHACKKEKNKTEKHDLDKAIKRAKSENLL